MAGEKISSFGNAAAPSDADLFTGLQGGLNKNFSFLQNWQYIVNKHIPLQQNAFAAATYTISAGDLSGLLLAQPIVPCTITFPPKATLTMGQGAWGYIFEPVSFGQTITFSFPGGDTVYGPTSMQAGDTVFWEKLFEGNSLNIWVIIVIPSNPLRISNNLSDVASVPTSRTNLGLGTSSSVQFGHLNSTPIGDIATSTGNFTTVSTSGQLTSTVSTGTAPLVVASTTRVSNLNVATCGNADTVTTNANLTGDVTSVGNATTYNGTVPINKGGSNATTALGALRSFYGNSPPTISGTTFTAASATDAYQQSFVTNAAGCTITINDSSFNVNDPAKYTQATGAGQIIFTAGTGVTFYTSIGTTITAGNSVKVGNLVGCSGVVRKQATNTYYIDGNLTT